MFDTNNQYESSLFTKKTSSKKENSAEHHRRSVRFAQTANGREAKTIYTVLSLSQMSKEEINNSWYDTFEFKVMKLDMVQILRKVIEGTYQHDISSLETEARGLENKTPKGSDARSKNRYASLLTVLNVQIKHREHGLSPDLEYMAKLYRQSSVHCQMKAIQIARNDARIVHGEQEFAVRERKTTQKKLLHPASPAPSRPTLVYNLASPHKVISRRHLLTMMS